MDISNQVNILLLCFHTAVDCGAPPNTTNGKVNVSSTTFNSEATYQCDFGFRFSPGETETRMCQSDGMWSGSTPSCNRT